MRPLLVLRPLPGRGIRSLSTGGEEGNTRRPYRSDPLRTLFPTGTREQNAHRKSLAVGAGLVVLALGAGVAWGIDQRRRRVGEYGNGTKSFEYRVDSEGRKQGPFLEWHPNGSPKTVATYRDDKLEGEYVAMDPDGTITEKSHYIEKSHYKEGKKDGLSITFDDEGQKIEAEYHAGKRDGVTTTWDSKGKLKKRVNYKQGKLVRVLSHIDEQGRETVLPEGEIDVWKLCGVWRNGERHYVYVQIRVPKSARRVTPYDRWGTSYKARVEYGTVIAITDLDGHPEPDTEAESCVYLETSSRLTYTVGKEVRASSLDEDPTQSCGAGINVQRYRDHCPQWIPMPTWPAGSYD